MYPFTHKNIESSAIVNFILLNTPSAMSPAIGGKKILYYTILIKPPCHG
jgi:hypothetical protein